MGIRGLTKVVREYGTTEPLQMREKEGKGRILLVDGGSTRTIRLSAYGLHPDCMRAAYELRMIAYKQMPLGYKYGDRSK